MDRARSKSDSHVLSILDDLRRVVRVLRESSHAAIERLGVTGAQVFVLRALAAAPALSLNELAERTRTHQSTVSVVVSRLVERRLVRRVPSERDGRRIELALTRAGRSLASRAPDPAQARLIAGLERLPPKKRALCAESMRALVEAMGVGDAPPPMFFEEETRVRRGR